MKKLFLFFLVLIFLSGVIFWIVSRLPDNDNVLIGGQTDKYGCLTGAGYQWCPSASRCQRMWEDYCKEFKDQFRVVDFKTCLQAGNPVMESYPRKCRAANGEMFTEDIGNELEKADLIRLDFPRPNDSVASPLEIIGQARGSWFFEGSFSVVLVNWDGLIIAEGQAVAQNDWMTDDFVPFKVVLEFDKPDLYDRGGLILKKDNPSGLPENDDALEIPITFK